MMYLYVIYTLLLFAVGCNSSDFVDADLYPQSGKVEVSISANPATRTEIGDDEQSVRWSIGDEVALWAEGAENNSTDLSGEKFTLRYYSSTLDSAEFAAEINEMSSDQQYSYSAFYPYQDGGVSGSQVSYTIPSAQSGEYDGSIDFRVADTVTGDALSATTTNGMTLSFRSMVHLLKISIPEGYNKLGVPVANLYVTLPENATGGVVFDMSNTTATPTLTSNQSSTITVTPTTPIDAGDGQVLWVFINPMESVTGNITIYGIGEDYEISYNYEIPLTDHTFSAGRITPINATIEEEIPSTTLQITIDKNNLGEELTNINLTAPSGAIFKESGSNTLSIENNGTGIYKASYITSLYGDKFSGATIDVEYESKWALITDDDLNLSLASITEDAVNNFSRTVPYILYEDFSEISSFNSNDNDSVGGIDTNANDQDVIDLSTKGLSTSGWTATRVGGGSGKAVRICCRYEYGTYAGGAYQGRIDSPQLKWLKDGATISVFYNYKGSRYSKYDTSLFSSWKYGGGGNVLYDYGVDTRTSSESNNTISSTSNIGLYGSYTIESPVAQSVIVENTYVGDDCGSSSTINTNSQNYDSITYSNTYSVSGASSSTRVSWRVDTDYSRTDFLGTNGNFWFYLDNVKVTIAN